MCQNVPVNYLVVYGSAKDHYYRNKDSKLIYSIENSEDDWPNITGREIKQYTVSVTNTDFQGGYFEVRFNFYDYYGNEWSDYITHYVQHGQKKDFTYTRIRESFSIYSWEYKIEPGKRSVSSVKY